MAESAKRVLIVDDAGLVRRFHRDALERAGFAVAEALNGVEALEKVLAEPFDLAIVDVNMPQMDGLSFIRALRRQDGPVRALPVLIITTESQPHDKDAGYAAGANFYLVKPARAETLVDCATLICGAAR